MKRFLNLSDHDKLILTESIRECLIKHPFISFAYLHGSFVAAERFRDIDVAVYLNSFTGSLLNTELELETELGNAIKKYPLDIRVLNNAPLSFRYNVIKDGRLLLASDDNVRADFVESTLSNYFDFAPFRANYLKEALGLGI